MEDKEIKESSLKSDSNKELNVTPFFTCVFVEGNFPNDMDMDFNMSNETGEQNFRKPSLMLHQDQYEANDDEINSSSSRCNIMTSDISIPVPSPLDMSVDELNPNRDQLKKTPKSGRAPQEIRSTQMKKPPGESQNESPISMFSSI